MKLTILEAKFLDVVAHGEMNPTNGTCPKRASDVECWLWLDEFADEMGITIHQIKGVLSSVKKKGLVATQNEQTDESVIMFTEKGFESFMEGIFRGDIK